LQLAIENNFTKLTVEGDSLIIINLLRKILNGASLVRISPSWRLLHGLQIIFDSLRSNLTIIPAHVRRKVNQVADDLANMGISWSKSELLCNSALEPDHPILQQCIRKAGMMDAPPDGVIVGATWSM
jgi:ribonuclease HI